MATPLDPTPLPLDPDPDELLDPDAPPNPGDPDLPDGGEFHFGQGLRRSVVRLAAHEKMPAGVRRTGILSRRILLRATGSWSILRRFASRVR
jgi:hypothetical protein